MASRKKTHPVQSETFDPSIDEQGGRPFDMDAWMAQAVPIEDDGFDEAIKEARRGLCRCVSPKR